MGSLRYADVFGRRRPYVYGLVNDDWNTAMLPLGAGYSGKVKSVWTVVAALASVRGDHCLFASSTLYQVMLSDRRNRGGLRSLHALAFGDDQTNLVAQI